MADRILAHRALQRVNGLAQQFATWEAAQDNIDYDRDSRWNYLITLVHYIGDMSEDMDHYDLIIAKIDDFISWMEKFNDN